MQVPFVDGDELWRRLPMRDAIDALEAAFRDGDPSATPLRSQVETPEGTLLLMPAVGEPGVGVKLVTADRREPRGGPAPDPRRLRALRRGPQAPGAARRRGRAHGAAHRRRERPRDDATSPEPMRRGS